MENNEKLLNLLLDLKERNEETSLPRYDGGVMIHRMIRHLDLDFPDHKLSVQASEYHYCHPRQTIELENYESYEIAMLNVVTGDFIDICFEHPNFPYCEELSSCYEGTVYAYVPIEIVAELYDYLKKEATAE